MDRELEIFAGRGVRFEIIGSVFTRLASDRTRTFCFAKVDEETWKHNWSASTGYSRWRKAAVVSRIYFDHHVDVQLHWRGLLPLAALPVLLLVLACNSIFIVAKWQPAVRHSCSCGSWVGVDMGVQFSRHAVIFCYIARLPCHSFDVAVAGAISSRAHEREAMRDAYLGVSFICVFRNI